MKDLYIEAEEDFLAEVTEAIENAYNKANNIISIDDLDEIKDLLKDAIELIDEQDAVHERVIDKMASAADYAVDRAKDPY